ncbi:T9SS type A sorting domain-containing protein [Mariniflexile jejuense]|uniref:T9SS type A sorting domain-containing protein n=1 Tax=Mariniflexile jejuense TaxID=1173582 RepID=A0ABW3JIK2_9FLAO
MKTTLLKNFLSFCTLIFGVGMINAQVITWTGTTNTDFGTGTNWDLGTIPVPANDVSIAPVTNKPILSAALSSLPATTNTLDYISHLTLQADSELTLAAKLWLYAGSGNYFGAGKLNIETGADINIRNQGRFGTNATSTQTVNVNGGIVNTKNQLIIGDAGDCIFNVNGGTVTSTLNGILLGNYAGRGTLNINGGLTTINAIDIDEQPSRPGTGIIVVNGGTLEITNAALESKINGYVANGKIVPAGGKTLSVVTDYLNGKITITAVAGTAKKVLYLNQIGVGQGTGASAPGADPVITMLQSDANFEVTYIESDQNGTQIPALSGFDLVIAQETFSSGAAVFKPGGKLGVKDVTIPIIYNKSYAFRDGKAVTDADASVPSSQTDVAVTVDPLNQGNELFRGISFAGGNNVAIFGSATASDNGTSGGGTKSIDAVINLDITAGGQSLATTTYTTDPATSMVINYLPSGTRLGTATTDVLTVNAVALSFSYGATIMGNGANISSQALTIWRNAAYKLTGLVVPNSLYVNSAYSGTLSLNKKLSNVSTDVYAIGDRVYVSNVKSSSEINIYSITGALVKSFKTNNDTNFNLKSGLYIATVKTFEGTKSVKLLTK